MDKDRIKGKVKEVAGAAQEARGKITGDEKDRQEGVAKQVEGKVQNTVGKAKDAVRKAIDKID